MVRAIAIFFLLYTGVEITVPQYCAEASGVVSISEAARDSTRRPVITATDDSNQKELPSEQPCADEDCFCCCAHVVPGRAVCTIVVSDLMPSFGIPRKIDLPSPPLQSPYHPPRLG
jgi:hypothetical protein